MKAPKRLNSIAACMPLLVAIGLLTLAQPINAEKAPLPTNELEGPVLRIDSPLVSQRTNFANELIVANRLADAYQFLHETLVAGTAEEKAEAEKLLEILDFKSEGQVAGRYAVTHLGGYENGWVVVGTRDSDFTTQRMSWFSSRFPKGWIRQQWAENFRITTLSGDKNGWCLVMSHKLGRKAPKQRYFGPAPVNWAMEEWIKKQTQEGLHITAVGGWGDQWVVVMTADTGWGTQQFLKPGKSEAEIAEWWEARQAEGHSITAMNGNFTFQRGTQQRIGASFMLVATQGLKLSEQRLEIDVPIPGSGQINTEAPVRIIAGYGQGKKNPAIVLRGGSPVEGSRQAVGTGSDCEKLIRKVWDEFHELDEIAKQQKKNAGE